MTQDEIIEMARQSGLVGKPTYTDGLVAFAKLVAQHEGKKYEDIITNMAKLLEMQQKREGVAVDMIEAAVLAEREACAKIADEWAVGWPHPSTVIAERIRVRGEL